MSTLQFNTKVCSVVTQFISVDLISALIGYSLLWDCAGLDTIFVTLKIIKVHLEFSFNFHSVLFDFQSFTEKPVLSVLLLIL